MSATYSAVSRTPVSSGRLMTLSRGEDLPCRTRSGSLSEGYTRGRAASRAAPVLDEVGGVYGPVSVKVTDDLRSTGLFAFGRAGEPTAPGPLGFRRRHLPFRPGEVLQLRSGLVVAVCHVESPWSLSCFYFILPAA